MDSYPLHGLCPPGSSVHWSLQARTLEWVAISFSRDSSWPRNWTLVSCIAGRFFTIWATRKALYPLHLKGNPGIWILSRKPRIEKDWVDKEAQFSRSVMSDSLWPHGLQYARPPCPSPTPGVYSDLCPLSWWFHLNISSSVIPFSSWIISFQVSGYFLVSRLFTSGGQSNGDSASTSVLPMNSQGCFPIRMSDLISMLSKGFSRIFSNTTVRKHKFFGAQPSLWSNSHICTWLLEKP